MWFALIVVLGILGLWGVGKSARRETARQIAVLAALTCPECKSVYGEPIARAALKKHVEECHAADEALPGCRINFVRWWRVTCPACGAAGRFHNETGVLEADEPVR